MKILIVHASAGAGHQKAAEAIYNGLKAMPNHEAVLIDALDYTSPFYKKIYRESYSLLISKVPWLWGVFFVGADMKGLRALVNLARRVLNAVSGYGLHKFLRKEQFDCVISTHFFPTEVAGFLKRTNQIRSKVITVITDFDVHTIWLSKGIDHYTTASDWTARKLIGMGIPQRKVAVTGIPTDEKFGRLRNKAEMRRHLGIRENVFTVLVATGSFGIGPIEDIVEELDGVQILVVCGHNRKLYERLSQKKKDLLKVLPLVNNMHELMAVSDVMITKPGGLSICEALVSGLPLIFFNAIPGQEEYNVFVLKEHGIGVSGLPIPEIAKTIQYLSASPTAYQQAVERTKVLAKPNAVKDIIRIIENEK